MSDLIDRASVLELIARLPTSIGSGGAALSIPPEVFRGNALNAVKSIPPATALAEAQAEIARLTARADRVEAALMPFVEAADECDEWGYDDDNQAPVDAGQCRAARAALTDKPDAGEGEC